ncbi:MAG: DUF4332 domain-containing protein [Cytophagaceae bacterium]|nr:DUF4332 domain-containing protein [Cytophagaceae bacterium]
MSISLRELKGVSDEMAEKLKAHNLSHSDSFLEKAATKAGRRALAEASGVEESLILEVANRADLARLDGVAGVYSDLLETAGVDTVKELAQRNAENLHAKLLEVNESLHLTTRPPSLSLIEDIIKEAKSLKPMIEH